MLAVGRVRSRVLVMLRLTAIVPRSVLIPR
jgi:hypothetical protein